MGKMTVPKVYIETTIPSFYYEVRSEPDMVARKDWTRTWLDHRRHAYELVTSEAVLDELAFGEYPFRDEALALVENLPLVSIEPSIQDTGE